MRDEEERERDGGERTETKENGNFSNPAQTKILSTPHATIGLPASRCVCFWPSVAWQEDERSANAGKCPQCRS